MEQGLGDTWTGNLTSRIAPLFMLETTTSYVSLPLLTLSLYQVETPMCISLNSHVLGNIRMNATLYS